MDVKFRGCANSAGAQIPWGANSASGIDNVLGTLIQLRRGPLGSLRESIEISEKWN